MQKINNLQKKTRRKKRILKFRQFDIQNDFPPPQCLLINSKVKKSNKELNYYKIYTYTVFMLIY